MKGTCNAGLRMLYGSVVTAGLGVLMMAGYRLIGDPAPLPWLVLSLLTLATGSLSLKIPGVNGRVSVGDTLICLTVILFGPLAGAVTAALDGITGSLRCRSAARRREFILYNACVMAVSAYAAGQAFHAFRGGPAVSGTHITAPLLPAALAAFAVSYFAVNTLLVAAASALDRSVGILRTWYHGFLWTAANYLAATFISGTLVQIADPMSPSVLVTLAIGSAGVYVSTRGHIRLAKEVERLKDRSPTAALAGRTADAAA